MTKQERAEMYRAYLAEEGFVPVIDEDGDICFKSEGKRYVIIPEEDDEEFFRLVYPNFWSIETEEERVRVILAAAHATSETKVAKVFPVADDTWATIELFCSPPESFKSVFMRSLVALQASVESFREMMTQK